ncbi:MAG: protease pro-enzyme activation domain-containing protein [Fimbriimonas sp.]|nr:protease pro-enzyme activation domain-containing protein [Fimbriimonas sp.]
MAPLSLRVDDEILMTMLPLIGCLPFFAVSALPSGQNALQRFVTLQKTPPPGMFRAIAQRAKPLNDQLHLAISLKPGDSQGLQSFADAVSDPKRATYREFISPTEVGSRFGLPAPTLDRVTTFLRSQGLQVTLVGKNRLTILADATVSQAERAFHVTIEEFLSPSSNGRPARTNFSYTTSPMIPASIGSVVQNISGLENFTAPVRRNLTPTQLKTLYSVAPLNGGADLGQGRTIGITSFDGFSINDEKTFVKSFGLPSPSAGAGTNIKVVTISGGSQTTTPTGEADLDIQASIGIVPLSNLIVYDGGNNDIVSVNTREANDNLADIITESYGWELDSATALSLHNLHLSMTAQGITYIVAAGDTGTDLQGFQYPDTDPEVLSVGGTSVTTDSSGNRVLETGWNNNQGAGGGGWVPSSDTFNIHPSWQTGTGVPSSGEVPYRLFPDVSCDADPSTGYFIYMTVKGKQNEYEIGGTSGASPTCTGSLAAAEQELIRLGALVADKSGHYRLGRIQDRLYSFNGDPAVFYDVTIGSNGPLPNGSTSNAGIGWDTDSGWGPIRWTGFVAKLAGSRTATLSGTVSFGDYLGTTPPSVTLKFRYAGESTPFMTATAALDAHGNYSIPNAPAQAYLVSLQYGTWLRDTLSVDLSKGGVPNADFSLINGDVNGDNRVSIADYRLIVAAYGSTSSDLNWNPRADLNGDGVVDAKDVAIYYRNYGRIGSQ